MTDIGNPLTIYYHKFLTQSMQQQQK